MNGEDECKGFEVIEPHLLFLCLSSGTFAKANLATLKQICDVFKLDEVVRRAAEEWNLTELGTSVSVYSMSLGDGLAIRTDPVKMIDYPGRIKHIGSRTQNPEVHHFRCTCLLCNECAGLHAREVSS